MRLAILGLGRMGLNMAKRLLRGGQQVVAYNRHPDPVAEAVATGAEGVHTPEAVVAALAPPRVLWLMLPAGAVTQAMLDTLAPLLTPGDILVDGGVAVILPRLRTHLVENYLGVGAGVAHHFHAGDRQAFERFVDGNGGHDS